MIASPQHAVGRSRRRVAALLAVIGASAAGLAQADTFSFSCYNVGIAGQNCTTGFNLSLSVNAGGAPASLSFANASTGNGSNSSISEIYFDYTNVAFTVASTSGAGTNFGTDSAIPPNIPSGNTFPGGPFTSNVGIDAENPSSSNGVNPGETLQVVLNGINGTQFLAGLLNGSIRVGLHLQGVQSPQGQTSAEYALTVAAVPEPTTWAMMAAGLGLFGVMLRRRSQRA